MTTVSGLDSPLALLGNPGDLGQRGATINDSSERVFDGVGPMVLQAADDLIDQASGGASRTLPNTSIPDTFWQRTSRSSWWQTGPYVLIEPVP